ncbi:MAG: NAD(P)/FAD-dependent oxidoreductase [Chitinophagales bacterium]|nr:NAD(P)/FAD-dependent oxidoreductase [Chitinophagales bacterium]
MAGEPYDVIIIGGGLAGLSLAIQLAHSKRKVALFEREKYPFHRVCGEYVSMESWNFLERIGLHLSEMQLPRITELQVSSVTGITLHHSLLPGGFGISRFTLDASLAELAKEKGARIFEECRVDEVREENGVFVVSVGREYFTAKVVIGAFGKRSNMDKKMSRSFSSIPQPPSKNWVGVKYHIKTDLPDHVIQLHNFHDGYCGISKVEDDRYCLCYLTKAENLRKYEGNILIMEEKLLSKNPFLKKYFCNRSTFLFQEPETISQISFDRKLTVEQHVMMIGDAAGLIAPLCGNGMSMALQASAICSPIIERFLSNGITRYKMEAEYTRQWRSAFSMRLTAGRWFQPLLVNSALSRHAISILKHLPFVVNKLVHATHGKTF